MIDQDSSKGSSLIKSAGDPLLARDWNAAVSRLPKAAVGGGAGWYGAPCVPMKAKNSSGADYDTGAVAIGTASIPTNKYEKNLGILTLDDPTWHSDINNCVVCLEPIPNGELGDVCVSGVCWAEVDGTGDWAMIDPDDENQFVATSGGFARHLGSGLVVLGQMQCLWRYTTTQDSQAPSATSATLKNLAGSTIATAGTISLLDPLGIMSDQTNGDSGYCICVGNEFHAIQAAC